MSHSTHVGFNPPPLSELAAASAARDLPCVPASWLGVRLVWRFSFGDDRGVGQSPRSAASAAVRRLTAAFAPLGRVSVRRFV